MLLRTILIHGYPLCHFLWSFATITPVNSVKLNVAESSVAHMEQPQQLPQNALYGLSPFRLSSSGPARARDQGLEQPRIGSQNQFHLFGSSFLPGYAGVTSPTISGRTLPRHQALFNGGASINQRKYSRLHSSYVPTSDPDGLSNLVAQRHETSTPSESLSVALRGPHKPSRIISMDKKS